MEKEKQFPRHRIEQFIFAATIPFLTYLTFPKKIRIFFTEKGMGGIIHGVSNSRRLIDAFLPTTNGWAYNETG